VNADTLLNHVLPLIESNLTIQEVAERLGISVEAACALVVASLRSN
jgi:orotate phosphoribosyltransferase-like protein